MNTNTTEIAKRRLLVELNMVGHSIVENFDEAVTDARLDRLVETWMQAGR